MLVLAAGCQLRGSVQQQQVLEIVKVLRREAGSFRPRVVNISRCGTRGWRQQRFEHCGNSYSINSPYSGPTSCSSSRSCTCNSSRLPHQAGNNAGPSTYMPPCAHVCASPACLRPPAHACTQRCDAPTPAQIYMLVHTHHSFASSPPSTAPALEEVAAMYVRGMPPCIALLCWL